VLGVSHTFTEMHRACGIEARALPNGVPPMRPAERRPSAAGRVRLCHVGSMTPHKGYTLVQAALKQGDFRNLELTVVDHRRFGGDEERDLWGGTPVRFVGKTPQERMHDFYAGQDVLLAPSIWPESFGLVSREALAAGLWVVASDIGAMGEDVTPGLNGWVVDVSTVEALLNVFREIDADPARFLQSPPPVRLRTAADQARSWSSLPRDPEPPGRPAFTADALARCAPAVRTGAENRECPLADRPLSSGCAGRLRHRAGAIRPRRPGVLGRPHPHGRRRQAHGRGGGRRRGPNRLRRRAPRRPGAGGAGNAGRRSQGRGPLPGFTDAHAHLRGIGERELTLNLEGDGSVADLQQRLGRGWLRRAGRGDHRPRLDRDPLAGEALPHRRRSRRCRSGQPGAARTRRRHALVANSAALRRAASRRRPVRLPAARSSRTPRAARPECWSTRP
jgi:hypothetical protein